MTSGPRSPFDALAIEPSAAGPFEQGDIAILIKPDGTVKALNFGNDPSRLRNTNPEDFTEADKIAYEQGRRLLALALAAGNPQVMNILFAIMDDPAVAEELTKIARLH